MNQIRNENGTSWEQPFSTSDNAFFNFKIDIYIYDPVKLARKVQPNFSITNININKKSFGTEIFVSVSYKWFVRDICGYTFNLYYNWVKWCFV